VLAPTLAYFAWHDALGALYDATIRDALLYTSAGPARTWHTIATRPTAKHVADMLMFADHQQSPYWAMAPFSAALVLLILLAIRLRARLVCVAIAWLFAGYASVVLSPREDWHYVGLAFPALVLLVVAVCELRPRIAGELFACACLLAFAGIWQHNYLPRRHVITPGPQTPAQQIGAAIRAVAKPGDTLLVDWEPFDIYVWAELTPASPFLYGDAPNRDAGTSRAAAIAAHPTFLTMLRVTRDQIIAKRFPAWDWDDLSSNYDEYWSTDALLVYRRKDSPPDHAAPAAPTPR